MLAESWAQLFFAVGSDTEGNGTTLHIIDHTHARLSLALNGRYLAPHCNKGQCVTIVPMQGADQVLMVSLEDGIWLIHNYMYPRFEALSQASIFGYYKMDTVNAICSTLHISELEKTESFVTMHVLCAGNDSLLAYTVQFSLNVTSIETVSSSPIELTGIQPEYHLMSNIITSQDGNIHFFIGHTQYQVDKYSNVVNKTVHQNISGASLTLNNLVPENVTIMAYSSCGLSSSLSTGFVYPVVIVIFAGLFFMSLTVIAVLSAYVYTSNKHTVR